MNQVDEIAGFLIFVVLIFVCFCKNPVETKMHKCGQVKKKLVELTVNLEKRVWQDVGVKGDFLSRKNVRDDIVKTMGSDGDFVRFCCSKLTDKQINCMLKAEKLLEMYLCVKEE